MDTIVRDGEYNFKELEKEIYRLVCEAGTEITRQILEYKDQKIFEEVDKKKYKSQGFRTTTVKTQYGNVRYKRRVYLTRLEDGKKAYVYLLDKAIGMKTIGLISENLAEIIADTATEAPYRETSASVPRVPGTSCSG